MVLEHEYYGASGFSNTNCCFIAKRYNKEWGYKPYEGESWICLSSLDEEGKSRLKLSFGISAEMTGVWVSEKGNVYLASHDGKVRHMTKIKEDNSADLKKISQNELHFVLNGIWGLNDELVFTWGSSWEESSILYSWDGKKWEKMVAPYFRITSMHGVSPDCIYAAGYDGGVAKWDGKKWHHFIISADELFLSIFVVDQKEQYAVGVNNYVMQGNGTDWNEIAQGPSFGSLLPVPLRAVAKWKDKLWIGADRNGLLCRIDDTDQLEVVKPNLAVNGIDARENLVLCCHDMIAATEDGVNFTGTSRGTVNNMLKDKKLLEDFK